jgi:DNA processing protein
VPVSDVPLTGLSVDESRLLDAMGLDPLGLDALQARTGWETSQLQVRLLELELEGLVSRTHGGLFQRLVRT